MRWLAVHLPCLPLEIFSRGVATGTPLAVVERSGGGPRILLPNPPAADLGLRPGMSAGAARALAADLRLIERDPVREEAALAALAAWAERFTSQVSLVPRGLLLEAAGSLRLFQGPRLFLGAVREGLGGLGYQARLCLAPTPEGALRLARAGWGEIMEDLHALRQVLAELPLQSLGLEPEVLGALGRMGLELTGGLLGLPRAGLARRFGADFVLWLDRLLGEAPDPRPIFEPPARYRGRLELLSEVHAAQALLFGARRLVLELSGFLIGRQAGALRLDWTLVHADPPPTRFRLGLLEPLSEAEPIIELLRERLERIELPAPVREIILTVDCPEPLASRNGELFLRAGRRDGSDIRLLERLRARLGPERVRGLSLMADHRPERASRQTPPGEEAEPAGVLGSGPPWLLARPEPLELRQGRPWRGGPLVLETDCRRIESGWWDGVDQARDYYVARTPEGVRLWIFRELRGQHQWFLHGVFG